MDMKLAGRKALVVGASSGIGLESARQFAAAGAEVAIVARSEDKLRGLARELGGSTRVIVADVGDAVSCQGIVPAAIKAMGGLDAVVYSAGICEPRLVKDMTLEDFRRHIDVNLTGNFIVAQAAALYMNEHDGRVDREPLLGAVAYGHGLLRPLLRRQGRGARADARPRRRVGAEGQGQLGQPGPIDTPMVRAEIEWFGGTQAVVDGAIARIPMKRFATPQEVAKAIFFLTADAPFATGSTLVLDGGTTMI